MSVDINSTSPVDKACDLIQNEGLGKERELVNDEGYFHCEAFSAPLATRGRQPQFRLRRRQRIEVLLRLPTEREYELPTLALMATGSADPFELPAGCRREPTSRSK